LPSSHSSIYSNFQFPQIQGCSILQVELHQSPFRLLPSSHSSPVSIILFPQIGCDGAHQLLHQLGLEDVITTSHIFLLAENQIELFSS
jgi:hypothetical protein